MDINAPELIPGNIKQARAPHELFVINVLLFHLLVIVVALNAGSIIWAALLPPLFTLALSLFTYAVLRRYRAQQNDFVAAHWHAALRRYEYLWIAYGVTLLILGIAWLLSHATQSNTADILFSALSRIAVMPTLLALMVLAFFEAGAIYQAMRGEVPKLLGKAPHSEKRKE